MSKSSSSNNSSRARIAAAVLLLCTAAMLAPAPSGAEDATVPDFFVDGETGWRPVGDELLPPPSGPGPVTFDKRHPYVDNGAARRTHTQPTYRVADLSNPILQPWAVEQMRKANEEVLAGKVPFRPRESCYPAGVPGFLVYNLAFYNRFLQTAKQVTIINEGGPELRRVYLNVPHSARVTPSWYGESVGHYEGNDTMLVDTIGVTTKAFVDNYRTPHSEKLHVVERFTVGRDAKSLSAVVTVEDPDTFNAPLTMSKRWFRVDLPMLEVVCSENNDDHFNQNLYPIPLADKPDF